MKRWLLGLALVGGCLFVMATVAVAEPLVTGDLVLYYDFEGDWVDVVPNQAGVVDPVYTGDGEILRGGSPSEGRVFPDPDHVRGSQSAVFDPLGIYRPEILTPEPDPTAFPDDAILAGTDDPPNWGPAVTMAAWIKVESKTPYCDPSCAEGQDHAIVQIRSSAGSFVTHLQANTSGEIRAKLRGTLQSENINAGESAYPLPGPTGWPGSGTPAENTVSEWFHVVNTYDSNATFGGQPGHWKVYYNGQLINQNFANGETDGFPTGAINLGDWGQGGWIGRVQDDNRQINGYMDELYMFTRAISEEEVQTLYQGGLPSCVKGDVNFDDAVNGLDVAPFVAQVLSGEFLCEADTNNDDAVNGLDVNSFVALVLSGGAAQAVPEPSTLVLAGLAALGLVWYRRR